MFLGSKGLLTGKVGMSLVALRRTEASSALDQLNHYFSYAGMPIASSHYWKALHGTNEKEIVQDIEGLDILKTCARNMGWMIKSFKESKITQPPIDENVPIENTIGAMSDLVKEGLVRYMGISEANIETIQKTH